MEEEVLYARSNRELSLNEIVRRWSVSPEILKRFILAAPNAQALAWDFAAPGPNWRLVELFDLHDATPAWLTSEEYASMFCGVSSPWDWECHVICEFAVYAECSRGAVSDTRLGEMAAAAHSAMERVSLEIVKKRMTSRPAASLRKIQTRISALACVPPSFQRDANLWNLWNEVGALIDWRDLSEAEDALFEDPSIVAHRARMDDPGSLVRILDEAIKQKIAKPRRRAAWEADALLREHFWELRGLRPRGALGEHRADYLHFTGQLCALHSVPSLSDHIARRRKK